MKILVALSRPAIAAAAGAATLLVISALIGAPNLPIAVAFFVAFLVAAAVQQLDRPRAIGREGFWRVTRPGVRRPIAAAPAVGMGPFDRFDDRAKRVLALAQDEALRLRHDSIGPEHVLLGLIREDGGAARVLRSLGLDLSQARQTLERSVGLGRAATTPSEITLSPRTKKVIELAIDEARRMGTAGVGTEHLLLGVAREDEAAGSRTLESLGLSLARIRTAVQSTLGVPESAEPVRPGTPGGDLDRFSDRGKRILVFAQEEATRLRHNYIGTEHLLLGLVRDDDGAGARALATSGVDLDEVREAVRFIIGLGERPVSASEITMSPRTKKVIHFALEEADRLAHAHAGTGHMLLGLIREGEGIAMGVLDSLKVDRDHLRARTLENIANGLP